MSILLLDSRHPSRVPLDVVVRHLGSVAYTADVPLEVREALDRLGVCPVAEADLLVAMAVDDPDAQARIAAGEEVLEVAARISVAQQVMRSAVARGEWERAQTHDSLLPYLREEVAEFEEAVHAGDPEQICEELADVLLQVLFHAELSANFDFADVAEAFVRKMRARAPYLFDGSSGIVPIDVQTEAWEAGKA